MVDGGWWIVYGCESTLRGLVEDSGKSRWDIIRFA